MADFNVEVKLPVLPSKQGIQRASVKALDDLARTAKDAFEQTVATFESKPTFTIRPSINRREIGTNDETYQLVSTGTRPHVITARRAKVLAFRVPFRPKTAPGRLRANRGFRGKNVIFRKRVRHPGIRARHFDRQVAEKITRIAQSIVEDALIKELLP